MISCYDILSENIIKTTNLIAIISRASKEQQYGIKQINDAVTSLDQGTQLLHIIKIADATMQMAKAIVDETNESNFIDKKNHIQMGIKVMKECEKIL